MVKKIIAVFCAAIMLVVVFTGCNAGKTKPVITKVNGIDRAVALDEDGNPVYDSSGGLRVYALDEDGYIVKDENGNPQYNYVESGNGYASDDFISTAEYTLPVPTGWVASTPKWLDKVGTDSKCWISFGRADSLDVYSFDAFVDLKFSESEYTDSLLKQKMQDYTFEDVVERKIEFTEQKLPGAYAATLIRNPDGSVMNYAVILYYEYGGSAYFVNYVSLDGVGYDPEFDFVDYLQKNMKFNISEAASEPASEAASEAVSE